MQGGKSILMMQTSCRAYLTFIGRAQEEIDLCLPYAPVCGGKKGNEYKGRRPEKSCCSSGLCPNYLPPPKFGQFVQLFLTPETLI